MLLQTEIGAHSLLEGFCKDSFWDIGLTWYRSWPRFTECFQETALVYIPCGWMWLCAPFYIMYLAGLPSPAFGSTYTRLHVLKLICLSLLIVMMIIDVVNAINDSQQSGETLLSASVYAPGIKGITMILTFIFMVVERTKRIVTSGVLFIFWLLLVICNIVPFYSNIEDKVYESDVFKFSLFLIQYSLFLVELFLHCWAEKLLPTFGSFKKPNPETGASFLSRLTFSWMNNLLKNGYKEQLTEAAMPSLRPQDRCENIVPRFLRHWTSAMQVYKIKSKSPRVHLNSFYGSCVNQGSVNDHTPLVQSGSMRSLYTMEKQIPRVKKKSGPSLIAILFKTFWMEYLLSQIWKLLYDVLLLCNPLLLGQLVKFVQSSTAETWHGYVLVIVLFSSTCMQTLLFHQVFHHSTSLGLRLKASIISSVFRKALTMDNGARKESTVGEIVNLMSVDAEHINSIMSYLWAVWSSPLQIIICLYMLYNVVGVSMFAGAAFLILLIPANGVISAILGEAETQLMTHKDERMKVMNELLNGIKIIKLFAWEKSFQKRIMSIREGELKMLRKAAILEAVLTFSWTAAPFVVSLLTFLCYVYISDDHYLDPQTAFVALSFFDILRFSINFAPMIVTDITKAVISARRISRFLCHDDLNKNNVSYFDNAEDPIIIIDGSFRWSKDGDLALKNVNLTVKDDSLTAVVGTVGSGKSSLLSVMLGDLDKIRGSINIRGRVAFVSQQAWIQNDSLRNNILFGKPMDQELYDRCVAACALQADLDILPAGDLTEIGERGINLSGGQKQRVSLARAVYSQADIYLLDDPLSAVDAHVGQHIFSNVIGHSGLLEGKVRVLVTHGIQYLPHTDHIIVMTNGQISEAGHYEKLLSHNGPFAKVITMFLSQEEDNDITNSEEILEIKQEVLRRLSETEDEGDAMNLLDSPKHLLRQLSKTVHDKLEKKEQSKEERANQAVVSPRIVEAALTEEESVGLGTVKLAVIMTYAKSVGYFFVLLMVLWYAFYTGSDTGANIFLSKWTDDHDLGNFTKFPRNSSERMEINQFYVGIYGLFGALQTIFIMAFALTESLRAVHASRVLHGSMLASILRAPMSFFDTTPVGRIVNRFSKDMDDVDQEIPLTFTMWIDCVFTVGSTLVVISYSTPIFMAFIVPIAFLYYFIQRYFIATSRQLKRLESKTRSPIFNHFSETLTGASIIRAFGAQDRFVLESDSRVDLNQVFSFSNYSVNRWLGVRLEIVGNLIIFLAGAIAVATKESISGGIMGLSITYALQITENLNWLVRMTSDLETQSVSVERIKEYTEISSEAAWESFSHKSPPAWPFAGHIKIESLGIRYRDGLDLVLKNISFEVQPGEKVGIVGRTGAGKSSLTLAIFRLVESAEGRIIIDNVDVSQLGLHDLRSKVTILPQDPVIFAGSLRFNLDPFEEYEDSAIWSALEHAHLRTFVDNLPNRLAHECGEGGENLSVGQRQLLCLGRALLRKTKILILDEATAAVDMETDELIQNTIKEEFRECTILTVAHRLNTVMDYDRILVLDKGEVKEFDPPQALLQNPGSLFYGMAKSAGLV